MAFIFTMLVRAIIITIMLVASWFVASFLLTFFGTFFNVPAMVNIGKAMRERFMKALNSLFKF